MASTGAISNTLKHFQAPNHKRQLLLFAFTTWPDHGVPASATDMIAFRNCVNACRRPVRRVNYQFDDADLTQTAGPVLVHCSAGVGRSGAFIATDRVLVAIQVCCLP